MQPCSQHVTCVCLSQINLVLDPLSSLLQIYLNISNKIVRFEYFTATECDEGISGEKWCETGVNIQRFRY